MGQNKKFYYKIRCWRMLYKILNKFMNITLILKKDNDNINIFIYLN